MKTSLWSPWGWMKHEEINNNHKTRRAKGKKRVNRKENLSLMSTSTLKVSFMQGFLVLFEFFSYSTKHFYNTGNLTKENFKLKAGEVENKACLLNSVLQGNWTSKVVLEGVLLP